MAELAKATPGQGNQGGKKGAPKGEGTVRNVSNDGTANGQLRDRGPRSSKHARDKSIGRK